MRLNATVETLPNNKIKLIVYADPSDPAVKIIHYFDSLDTLNKHIDKATRGQAVDVTV